MRPSFGALICLCVALGACAPQRYQRIVAVRAAPACHAPPFAAPLYLRGTMTDWALRDDQAFTWHCDAYYLNVQLRGLQQFRISDPQDREATSFGAARSANPLLQPNTSTALVSAASAGQHVANLQFAFAGAQTIRVDFDAAGAATPAANPHITIGPQSFVDPAALAIDDPIAQSLHFDSRDANDKTPFGAITAGSEVQVRLRALPGISSVTLVIEKRRLEGSQEVLDYAAVAQIPLSATRAGANEIWQGRYRYADIGIYGYYFLIDIGGKRYLYQNNADPIYWTRELGSNGVGMLTGATDATRIRRYRQTVYRADYRVPDWARDIVYYYIFPERFRNGDPRNDPKPGIDKVQDHGIELHKNWLDKPYKPGTGDGSDAFYGNDFFGGDLQGIIDKLDYIAALGANALYITPLFQAASNHKYDTADYTRIDPHFGSNADFVRLTRAAARRGIRVIPDTSLNHSGSDSRYFDRYDHYPGIGAFKGGKIRTDSPYADWYHFDATQTDPDKEYRGWVGAQDLPELNKASTSYRQFAFGAADSVMNQWLDRGAAGWRMDVAPWVPDDFWRDWRSAVKAHRPDALTIAETQFDAAKFFLGDEFDSTMNYIFRNAVQDYANGKNARETYRAIELMRENYPPQAFYALMNLLSTHDSSRALYDFGYRDEHADAATIALAKQRLRLAVFFQMIFPGAPAIFYGDEVGVTGGDDPYNRVTYPWADLGGKPDNALLADYRKLIKLRRDNPILRHGSIDAPTYIDDHLIVLIRQDGKRGVITALNNDQVPHSQTIALPASMSAAIFVDALSGKAVTLNNGSIDVQIPAQFGTVLVSR